MARLTSLQKRRVWLVVATLLLMALVGAVWRQDYAELQEARRQQAVFTESFAPTVYQLEREYLRFASELELAALGRQPPDMEALNFRHDLLLSRIEVVDNALAAESFRQSSDFASARLLLDTALRHVEPLLQRSHTESQDWSLVNAEWRALGPAMNALTMRASLVVSKQQEYDLQEHVRTTVNKLQGLGFLLALLLVCAFFVAVRQGRVEREQRRLHSLHDELRLANEKAEAANAGKSSFLANMSHELRTPLNGMLGMLSLLEFTPLNGQQDDYIQTANRSAKHLLSLLNDILDASALEAGKMTLKPEPVMLSAMAADVQSLMRPVALEKRLTLEVSQDKRLHRWVSADSTRVKQIMLNLVSNALKFSEHGTVRLDVSIADEPPLDIGDTAVVTLRVTDQGMGMTPEVLERLFQRFEQGDASSARRFGGTGLGLEISRNLARCMDGDIVARSEPGQGSEFIATLRLPVCGPPTDQAADAVTVRREPGTPGLDMLVAEDNAINRKYMQALLTNMGHTVRFAEHGGQAVEAVQVQLPDIVLMDLHMPDVDGLQATEGIRRLPKPYCDLPIIALTADVLDESRERVLAGGMDGFLAKPVNLHALERKLVRRFGVRGASIALPLAKVTPKPAEEVPAHAPAVPAEAASAVVPADAAASVEPVAPKPRRRFRPGDVAEHLNMAMIGELCIGVTLQGYQSLLDGVMRTDTNAYTDLLDALRAGRTDALLELGHSFKGVTASLGLAALSRMALTIEKQGHSFTPEECSQHADALHDCWSTTGAICARMGFLAAG